MTPEQFHTLLQELARIGGLHDSSSLLEHGRVNIGDCAALLIHEPAYDPDLLQLRIILGTLPEAGDSAVMEALLQANYVEGYGGECVFSLVPESGEAVVTLRLRLRESMSATELWQGLSDLARHGSGIWESIISDARPLGGLLPAFHSHSRHL
jgi:hypothetical protein